MKDRLLSFCLVLLLLHGVPGCGLEEKVIVPTLSVCGMACVDGLRVDNRMFFTGPLLCDAEFRLFENSHESYVCGQSYEVVAGSKCVNTAIVGTFMALACVTVCYDSPDVQACSLTCLLEEMGWEGNCLVCYVEEAVRFRSCLAIGAITPEEVSACVSDYIVKSAACRP